MRKSIYKEKILALLSKEHILTITKIHTVIKKANYSTIFRNIERLLKEKQIRKITNTKKISAYELASHAHDHFICDSCNTIETVVIPRSNISLKGHIMSEISVRGICKECQK